jgi:imidazolonepropionase-like amidohydrolase
MQTKLLLFSFVLFVMNAAAQQTFKPDSGTFVLHKFENPIGKESYYITTNGKEIICKSDFKLADRGATVHLVSEFKTSALREPLSLVIKSKSETSNDLKDSISINGTQAYIEAGDSSNTKNIEPLTFPVDGYAPGTLQQELLQYWKNHGQPLTINTLPSGFVHIKKDGTDTFSVDHKALILDRLIINNLVWGNEFLWADHEGRIAGIITNDASADKFEIMREPYETLLPEFVNKVAIYGTRTLLKGFSEDTDLAAVKAITGGTFIDVIAGKAIPNSVIILQNGKIQSVGIVGSIKIPANATIIDATGKTILPGLWDMHAHFGHAEWGPAYLAAGVTTIRDCTDEFDYINLAKKAIDEGAGIGPAILKAGLIDGSGPNAMGVVQADSKAEAIAAVDRYKNNGYTQIKIYSSVKPMIVKAICEEAHRVGLTVTGHIPNGMTVQQGIDSGMDMVNHAYFVYASLKRNKDFSINFDDSANVAAINFIKQHHTVVDATVGSMELVFRSKNENITRIEPAFYTLPLPLQLRFKNSGMDSAIAVKYIPMYNSILKLVKVLFDASVPVVAGSDEGFPGYSLDRELELYVQAGFTPMQAIQSATIVPARAMKSAKEKGSIEPGKQADLVIVNDDPLTDISNIRKVYLVVKGTHIYKPADLHKLVGFSN